MIEQYLTPCAEVATPISVDLSREYAGHENDFVQCCSCWSSILVSEGKENQDDIDSGALR